MGRHQRTLNRYFAALKRFKESSPGDVVADLRNAHSLKELMKVRSVTLEQENAQGNTQHLVVVDIKSEHDLSKVWLNGWARKTGMIVVPAEEHH